MQCCDVLGSKLLGLIAWKQVAEAVSLAVGECKWSAPYRRMCRRRWLANVSSKTASSLASLRCYPSTIRGQGLSSTRCAAPQWSLLVLSSTLHSHRGNNCICLLISQQIAHTSKMAEKNRLATHSHAPQLHAACGCLHSLQCEGQPRRCVPLRGC